MCLTCIHDDRDMGRTWLLLVIASLLTTALPTKNYLVNGGKCKRRLGITVRKFLETVRLDTHTKRRKKSATAHR